MKEGLLLVGNYFLFLFSTGILLIFQSSFWLEVASFSPPPYTWMPILTYWTLYRNPKETLIILYLVTFLISSFTAMPLSILITAHLLLFGLGYFLKLHIYWSSTHYFLLFSGTGTLLLPLIYFIPSLLLGLNDEKNFHYLLILEWMISSLLTTLLSLPLYKLFRFFDKITERIFPQDVSDLNIH